MKRMRLLVFSRLQAAAAALLLGLCLAPNAAVGQEEPLRKLTLTPDGGAQRIVLPVTNRLLPGDELVLWSPTRRITANLIGPDGREINEQSAAQMGVDWLANRPLVDSEEADAPMTVSVRFQAMMPPGDYAFAVTPDKELTRPVEITLALRANAAPVTPGVLIRGPVKAAPQAKLEWTVAQDEDGATIDVVVSDPTAKVVLRLPGGFAVHPGNAKEAGLRWKTSENPQELEAPGGLFNISGFYLPVPGLHHVISFARAPRGNYVIEVQSERDSGSDVNLAFLATGRMMHAAYDIIERGAQPTMNEVKMEIEPIADPVHVGDPVPVNVDFPGEPVRRPIRFQVRAEYKDGSGGPPLVRTPQMYFGWSLDNLHRSYFQPEKEGSLQLTITAEGQTVTGLPFSKTVTTPELRVRPMAARFLGLWEQPIDRNDNKRIDQLSIHSELEVVRPGRYQVKMKVTAPNKNSIGGVGVGELPPGRQRVTVTFSAAQVRKLASGGPYRIHDVEVVLLDGDTTVDRVSTPGMQMNTTNYRLEQFEPGHEK